MDFLTGDVLINSTETCTRYSNEGKHANVRFNDYGHHKKQNLVFLLISTKKEKECTFENTVGPFVLTIDFDSE